jgi:hypothetical protein
MQRRTWILATIGLFFAVPALAADEAQTVIDKAIKAAGGEAALNKSFSSTWKAKGTVHVMGLDIAYTSEDAFQAPDRFRTKVEGEVMGNKFSVVIVYDRGKASRDIGGQVAEMTGDELDEVKERVYFQWVSRLVPLTDKAFTLASVGEVQVEGKPAIGIKISHKGHGNVNLFFDKSSGLLVKGQQRVKNPMTGQEQDQEAIYSDYKETQVGKHPMKVKVTRDGQPFVESEVTDHQHVDKFDETLFQKP